jgi:hypothetical protein
MVRAKNCAKMATYSGSVALIPHLL